MSTAEGTNALLTAPGCQESSHGPLLSLGELRQHVGGSCDLLRNGALKIEDGRALSGERRLGRLDRGERPVDLGQDRARGAGRRPGLLRSTPRLLDLAQTIQRVLQEQRSSCEGGQPFARLKVSLLPKLLLQLDHVEGRMAAQDRLGGGQLEIHLPARLVQMFPDRLALGGLGQRPGQGADQPRYLCGACRDLRHGNRVRGGRRGGSARRARRRGSRFHRRGLILGRGEVGRSKQGEGRKQKPSERNPSAPEARHSAVRDAGL